MPLLSDISYPLQQAFVEIMKAEKGMSHKGVDLDGYLLLIETLKSGYGLNSKEELLFLCKKLWLKPFHLKSTVMNEQVLEQIIEKHLAIYERLDVVAAAPPADANNLRSGEQTVTDDATLPSGHKSGNQTNEEVRDLRPAGREPVMEEVPGDVNFYISETADEAATTAAENGYDHLFTRRDYTFDNKYLPVSRRFLEQTIRSLRYKVRGAGRPAIDVAATVEEVARKGYFNEWKTLEEDSFVTRWTLMIDHDGSMAAFKDFTDALVESATTGSIRNEGDVFYFHNYVKDVLFTNPEHTRSIPFRRLTGSAPRNILIVSDAGGARRDYNENRVTNVFVMLHRLKAHRIAWLNPLPENRWQDTSAEAISKYVRMFEPGDDNSDHMGNIIQFFKIKGTSNIGL